MSVEEEKIPVFIQVKHLFSIRTVWFLCGRLLVPEKFAQHIHAYQVEADNSEWITCRPDELFDPIMHDFFVLGGHPFVSLRHESVSLYVVSLYRYVWYYVFLNIFNSCTKIQIVFS